MNPDLLLTLTQFGAAGLIGILWILERRHAVTRDRQLEQAHRKIFEAERDAQLLLNVVRDNTRAIAALEGSQQQLADLLRTLTVHHQTVAPTTVVPPMNHPTQSDEHVIS